MLFPNNPHFYGLLGGICRGEQPISREAITGNEQNKNRKKQQKPYVATLMMGRRCLDDNELYRIKSTHEGEPNCTNFDCHIGDGRGFEFVVWWSTET
jgi:hypothetical protein